MTIPEKYQDSIGPHGFPTAFKTVDTVIAIAKRAGDYLAKRQNSVTAGYSKPLTAEFDHIVKLRNGTAVVGHQKPAYDIMRGMVQGLTVQSGIRKFGILAEEQDKLEGGKDAYWVFRTINKMSDYINGGRDWNVSIGFAVAGQPTGGVVYYPVRGEVVCTNDGGGVHREHMRGADREQKRILEISHDLDLQRTAEPSVLMVHFAKTMPNTHNYPILSNVALQAIASRVSNQDYVVTPELPKQIVAPQ